MSTNDRFSIFDTPFHNPSIYDVRSQCGRAKLIDFCVPANSYFPPPRMVELIKDNLQEVLKYYPDYAPKHQANIALVADVGPEYIVPANGVTEIITVLCHGCEPPILTDTPTFGRWTDLPLQRGTPIDYLKRSGSNDFALSIDQVCARAQEVRARTLVISNPNNPTGAWLTLAEIAELAKRLRHLDLIVIDESFIEFSGLGSAERMATAAPNVVVVKSMGKALGWHGIRLGYAVANRRLAEQLRAQVPYWNVNGLAGFVLKRLGEFMDEYRGSFPRVAQDREYMFEQLRTIGSLKTFPSKANFLLSELPPGVSGKEFRNQLIERYGLFVRECSNKIGSSERFVRNVVRQRNDVDQLVAAMKQLLP